MKLLAGIASAVLLVPAPTGCGATPPLLLQHTGMGGASAAVDLGGGRIAVANDEDNRIRIYRADADGGPESFLDVGGFLRVQGGNTEADLEGAARVGDRIYWIGSHGRAKEGRLRPNRHRFFATDIFQGTDGKKALRTVGTPCSTLMEQLSRDAAAAGLGLVTALATPPNQPGGLNIEALAEGPEGSVYIGFRSPVPNGRALIVPLLNPGAVIQGQPARFGPPIHLDLDGRGLRDMARHGDSWYLLGGGGGGEDRKPKLYRWNGGTAPAVHLSVPGLKNLNPEALTVLGPPAEASLLVCSDDGGKKSAQNRSFRSFQIQPAPR
jgi:hypothetical protein